MEIVNNTSCSAPLYCCEMTLQQMFLFFFLFFSLIVSQIAMESQRVINNTTGINNVIAWPYQYAVDGIYNNADHIENSQTLDNATREFNEDNSREFRV